MEKEKHPLSHRIRSCGSYLELREWQQHDHKCTVQSANFCKKSGLCHMCAIRRAAKMTKAYEQKINQVLLTPEHQNLIPVMITATIKNRDDFKDAFNHLKLSWSKLLKKSQNWKQRTNKPAVMPELVNMVGAVYAYEFKVGKGGKWHPHIHMFALLSNYIDQEKLSQEWLEATGDSFIIGVTECKNGILKGLIECLKYSTKFGDMTPEQIVHVYENSKGSALVSPLGILRKVPIEDIDSDEQLDGDYIDYIAHYLYSKKGYKLKLKSEVHEDVIAEGERRIQEEIDIARRRKRGLL